MFQFHVCNSGPTAVVFTLRFPASFSFFNLEITEYFDSNLGMTANLPCFCMILGLILTTLNIPGFLVPGYKLLNLSLHQVPAP